VAGTLIRDVMTKNPVCATPGMSVRELAGLFAERRISGAPVVGKDGTLLGVVSRTDLFRRLTQDAPNVAASYLFDLLLEKSATAMAPTAESLIVVGDFMAETAVTAGPEEQIGVVARRMADKRVHRVVVIDGNKKPVGMVTALDLLKYFPV
jgi:CBS domain-containing protein